MGKKITPEIAKLIKIEVNKLFSDISFVRKAILLFFDEGAGLIPNSTTIEISMKTWGNPYYAVGRNSIKLPKGIKWENLISEGFVSYNGLLRYDILNDFITNNQ